jgi:hypothetical protein
MSQATTGDIWDQAATAGNPGYARIAQFGLSGTGKTFTSIMIALGIRERFQLDGPIGALDTENGYDYLRPIVHEVTGQPLLVVKTRNLNTWCEAIDRAEARGNMVLVADSATHIWKRLCDGYLEQLQQLARQKNWRSIPTKLEFKDWNPIKQQWAQFADRFMNAKVHMIVSGRAGWQWDMQEDDRGKKELVKLDAKMKAEGEFEFEGALSLHFERHRTAPDQPAYHTVTVRKDRSDKIMGQVFKFVPRKTPPRAICEFLRPHLETLRPTAYQPTDTADGHDFELDTLGNDSRKRAEGDRAIVLEKIHAELHRLNPSQSAADKAERARLQDVHFATVSKTELAERVPLRDLRDGLAALRDRKAHQQEQST